MVYCKSLTLMIVCILLFNLHEVKASSYITSPEVNAKYQVERVLVAQKKKGPKHSVYQAKDRINQNKVVIKKVRNKYLQLIGNNEERIHTRLTSENRKYVISLIEIIKDDNFTYFVTEYASGGDLFDYIIENGKLNEVTAKEFIRQIAHIVEYMHKRDIAHRDLKPENIVLMSTKPNEIPNLKVIDFGHACYTNEPKNQVNWGTAFYTAPDEPCDFKQADVYSMGMILYVVLTKKIPDINFERRKIKLKEFERSKLISTKMARLIENMTNKDQKLRYSVEQIKSELEGKYFKTDQILEMD